MEIKTNRQSAAKFDLEFKPFPVYLDGYEKKYKVANDGRIWSEYLQDFMKPYYSKGGYLRVKINFGDRNKKFMVHRLVAMAFIENDSPESKTQVDHINCDRTNNNVDNLRWVTPKENTIHSIDSGLRNVFTYVLINHTTNETLTFDRVSKLCKYFNTSMTNSTPFTQANTGRVVKAGVFAGWEIQRYKKVQRPSLAREQGQASRNGNNPSDIKSRVLIWSNLIRNNERFLFRSAQERAQDLRTVLNTNGGYFSRSVRADFSL